MKHDAHAEKEPILKFEHFGFQYNAQQAPTLYDICLEVHKGERILIAGPSGCGKSTLIHCMNGLIPFSYKGESTGLMTIAGQEAKKLSLHKISRTVGTVLQDSDGQFVGMTVAEDIAFALENDCIRDPQLHDRVQAVAQLVNLQDFLSHAPGDLSGGQKQRVSMAGILVDDVDVLLFDEPLANLDPATGKQAIELIEQLQKETGAAVIIVEHRLEDVLHRHVDRVVVMQAGHILSNTSADELLATEILSECGIREPLYVTALKYAGVTLTPEMLPASLQTIRLSEAQKQQVRDWFHTVPAAGPAAERPVLLETQHLEFAYSNGHRALEDISLKLREGELLAIVGTNGAGKSTFAKAVCGFEQPQQGVLKLHGEDMTGQSIKERADHIGYVMQNPNQMICKVMIFDEVAMGLRTRNVPEEEIRPRVEQALKVCGLWPFRNWPVGALSFGQKKRVTIASILVLEPELIILDEPTAGQDYRHYTEIMEFLTELNRHGITIAMITHDMHLMLEYAHRVVVFSHGRIIADDTGANILTDQEIVDRASLKETSLYALAMLCGLSRQESRDFVQRFIDHEREVCRR